jgi:putative PIN family toxin of toxin-antitoxin system
VKVFLDTNVLISAFTTRGLSADLYRLLLSEHEPMTGSVNLVEFKDVLERKFRAPAKDIKFAVQRLKELTIIELPEDLPAVHVRDPDDLSVLACAIAGEAELLVTGDKDLLTVRAKLPLRIVTPRVCWEFLRAGGSISS